MSTDSCSSKCGRSATLGLSVLLGVVIETQKIETHCESCCYMAIMGALNNNVRPLHLCRSVTAYCALSLLSCNTAMFSLLSRFVGRGRHQLMVTSETYKSRISEFKTDLSITGSARTVKNSSASQRANLLIGSSGRTRFTESKHFSTQAGLPISAALSLGEY